MYQMHHLNKGHLTFKIVATISYIYFIYSHDNYRNHDYNTDICVLITPTDMTIVRTVIAVVGKGFSSAAFATLVLYSSELYPTVVRQV